MPDEDWSIYPYVIVKFEGLRENFAWRHVENLGMFHVSI